MHIYVYTYIFIYIYIHINTYIYIHIHTHTHSHTYVYQKRVPYRLHPALPSCSRSCRRLSDHKPRGSRYIRRGRSAQSAPPRQTPPPVWVFVCVLVCIQTHTHTIYTWKLPWEKHSCVSNTHTHTHTHTHKVYLGAALGEAAVKSERLWLGIVHQHQLAPVAPRAVLLHHHRTLPLTSILPRRAHSHKGADIAWQKKLYRSTYIKYMYTYILCINIQKLSKGSALA
jgi:hypothetical protein